MSSLQTNGKPLGSGDTAGNDLVSSATRDQLAACARLLAENLAQYRRRFGTIPLDESLIGPGSDKRETALIGEGEKILLEALDRIDENDQGASPTARQKVRVIEQREYARIHVRIQIEVSGPDDGPPSPARLTELSWGGASFSVSRAVATIGDEIRMNLPFSRGAKDISVTARVIRTWDLPEGQGVAVRFSSLTPDDDQRLERVLLLLLDQEGGDRRTYPRLARRIEIEYTNRSDWQATLENISHGGMSLTLPYPVKVDQSLQLMLSETSGSGNLTLRGRVVHEEPILFGDTRVHQISLEFEHPNDILQQSVKSLLRSLAISTRDELPRAVS